MNNWWKSPVLQGEENDYGDYDYLIEEIPKTLVNGVLGIISAVSVESGIN